MRRFLLALVLALWPVAAAAQEAVVPVLVIDGRGFGHGVGMAQEGAYWMAAAGASTEQIFGQFYPGAGFGRARGPVRVPLLDAGRAPSSGVLAFPDGGEVRENGTGTASPGFPLRVPPGGEVLIGWDGGRYRVEPRFATGPSAGPAGLGRTDRIELASGPGRRFQIPTVPTTPSTTAPPTTTTTAGGGGGGGNDPPPTTVAPAPTPTTSRPAPAPTSPPPSTTSTTAEPAPAPAPPPAGGGGALSSPVALVAVPAGGGSVAVPSRQRRYRGVIEATAAGGTLRLVNAVDLETYLKGMGEVRDPSWPPAALRAQAIAARTYAMRAMAAGGEICDTQRCQVYLGSQAEYGAMNKAVDDSREQVLVFNRALISAVYSANGGGFSASREEGFGVTGDDVPYLRAAPYLTKDPGAWSVTVALSDVGRRFAYPGTVTDVRLGRAGPSGRAIEVVLEGSAGPKVVAGIAFDAGLGLRSTLFTLRIEAGVAPPPPPPAEEAALQAPPDEAAASVAEALAEPEAPPTTRPASGQPPPPAPRRSRSARPKRSRSSSRGWRSRPPAPWSCSGRGRVGLPRFGHRHPLGHRRMARLEPTAEGRPKVHQVLDRDVVEEVPELAG